MEFIVFCQPYFFLSEIKPQEKNKSVSFIFYEFLISANSVFAGFQVKKIFLIVACF